MADKMIDFDAALKEIGKKEPKTVKLYGQVWEIAASLPAIIPLKAMRLMKSKGADANLPADEVFNMSQALFGEANLEAWLTRGLSIDELAVLLRETIASFQNGNAPNREGRRARTKTTKKSTSSKTGARSKRTSNGSTA